MESNYFDDNLIIAEVTSDMNVALETEIEISSEPLYCVCQEPWDKNNRRFMIECDHCRDWFHGACIGLPEISALDIEKYHCPKCQVHVGPIIYKLVNNLHRHDYADSEASTKPIQAGTKVFIEKLKEKEFKNANEIIIKMRGENLTLPYLMVKGFNRPIIIEKKSGIGIKIPSDDFKIEDVERLVGSERMLDVIDVQRQKDVKMTMHEFKQYFISEHRQNRKYNLISLEFSKTELSKHVEPPYIARRLDWVYNYWPKKLDDEIPERPEVSKYCLISSYDSYTDFHIDFGGTSVWYHILWGEKVFYLIEPTPGNLALYERWMASTTQYESFFPDMVDSCYKCILKKGETLFIPTGWIHAVLTTEDSLVFGGNFLNSLNMDIQLKIYEIEKRLNVPNKYLFPSFETIHWFAADGFVDDWKMIRIGINPPNLIRGAKELLEALKTWSGEKEIGEIRKEYIPPLSTNRIIKNLSKEIRLAIKRDSLGTPLESKKEGDQENIKNIFKSKDIHKRMLEMKRRANLKKIALEQDNNKKLTLVITKPTDSPSTSPSHSSSLAPIKIKLKKQVEMSGDSSCESYVTSFDSVNDDSLNSSVKNQGRLKIRLSSLLSDRSRVSSKSDDIESNMCSPETLYIAESESELKINTDDEKESNKKRKKIKDKGKLEKIKKRENIKNLDDALAGTLNGIDELIKSSNYTERIQSFEGTSSMKEAIAGMLKIGNEGDLLSKKKGKKKGKDKTNDQPDEFDLIEKVHQDADFIYLPLAGGSDDDDEKSFKKKKRSRSAIDKDESWSPRVKMNKVSQREHRPSRLNAKREYVEKGLEKAAAQLASVSESREKRKYKKKVIKNHQNQDKKIDTNRIFKSSSVDSDNLSGSAKAFQCSNMASSQRTATKKPKKGMATPKQRLGRILKIHKMTKF